MEYQYMDGWKEIIEEMKKEAEPYNVDWVQIKEKFGTLRAYNYCPSEHLDIVNEIVKKAEAKSAKTCVFCGKHGKMTHHGWAMTLCGECEANRVGG